MESTPLVSVCIPTYNGAKFIEAALDSVLEQTYSNIEIIVSDDTSNDQTLELIKSYIPKTKFPITIHSNDTRGIGYNWNNCMKYANGDFIKFLFQDDIMMPDCVAEMVKGFHLVPQAGLVACKRSFIVDENVNSKSVDDWLEVYGDLQQHLNLDYNPVAVITKSIFKSDKFYSAPVNFVGEPTAVMFKRDLIKTLGWFRNDLNQFLDFEYWFRILKEMPIVIIDKKLIEFRIHQNQATQQNKGKMANDVAVFKRILYKDYFWLLSRYRKKQLFLEFNPIGVFLSKVFGYK
ncbi:glycosyltransferase [Psychroserpens sp. XS_ASV72]|uniref:glycosyltransferase n=1 Tax=Psychroserpens sp. XS_ASV72 TaxID=3241293 RepID=UPI003515A2CC